MNHRPHSPPRRAAAPSQAPAAPPLWQQLDAVAQCLQSVLEGQSSRSVLARVAQPLRPGVQALLFQVLRQLGRSEERRVGKSVDLGGRRIIKKKIYIADWTYVHQ